MSAPKRFPKLQKLLLSVPAPSQSVSRKRLRDRELESVKEQKIVKVDRFEFIASVKEKIARHDFGIPLNSTEYYCKDTGEQILVISTTSVNFNERAKYFCDAKAVITSNRTYYIQALFKTVEEGKVESVEDVIAVIQRLVASDTRICHGIDVKTFESLKDSIGHEQLQSVQITNDPFTRISSIRCTPFFHLKRKTPQCYECLKLLNILKRSAKFMSSFTPDAKLDQEKAEPSSPVKNPSPANLEKKNANNKKTRVSKKLTCAQEEIVSTSKQTDETCEMPIQSIGTCNNVSSNEFLSIFTSEEPGGDLGVTLRQLLENAESNKNKESGGGIQPNHELSLVTNT